jgi:tetratricopeptide (TPR) repeat protein
MNNSSKVEAHPKGTKLLVRTVFNIFSFKTNVLIIALGFLMGHSKGSQVPDASHAKVDGEYQAGMRLLNEKRYGEALDEFRRVEHLAPNLPQGYHGEGIALALLGQLEEATKVLNKALELDPSFWWARRELGIVEWQLQQKDQAAKELTEIVKLFPADAVANSILGQYEFGRGNYSQAAEYFAAGRAEIASNPGLQLMAAHALLQSRQVAAANELLDGLRRQGNLSPPQRFELGWLLGRAKHYQKAVQVFRSLPKDYPDQLGVQYGLALAFFEQGEYSDSAAILKDYSTSHAATPEVLSLLGVAEEKSGHTLEAFNAFRRGIQEFPKDNRCYLDMATLAAVHLNYDLGLQVAADGIERIPTDYKLFLAHGILYSLTGQLVKAQSDYEKALALAPGEGSIYVALGMGYEDQNKYAQAAGILRQAIQRQIKDALVYYFLADALLRDGVTLASPLYEEVRSAVESCLSLNPEFAFAYLQRAKLELMNNRLEEAIADLERARALEPDSEAILNQLGIAYRRAGRKAESEKCFAELAQSNKKEIEDSRVRRLVGIMVTASGEVHGD